DPQHPGERVLTSRQLTAELTVDRIEAHDVRHIHQGENDFDVHFDGECTNVKLVLPQGSATASGRLVLGSRNGEPRMELKDFTAHWNEGSWQVASMNCTSPAEGFGV